MPLTMNTRAGKIERVTEAIESLIQARYGVALATNATELQMAEHIVLMARGEIAEALGDLMTPILRSTPPEPPKREAA